MSGLLKPFKSFQNEKSLFMRILTAVFYGVASFMIMVVNKQVLTVHKFPSFQVKIGLKIS